jgi:DNA-binding HxlR family transcriptional regulator
MGKEGTNSCDRHIEVTPSDIQDLNDDVDSWGANGLNGPCTVRDLVNRIGDKWSVLVILRLGRQPERFRQLLRSVEGISQRMLTVTLRSLERDGLVNRQVLGTSPPAVEYSLTPLGFSFLSHVAGLAHWAIDHEAEIIECRKTYDETNS